MKKRIRIQKKRQTLRALLLKALICSALVITAFIVGFQVFLSEYIRMQAWTQLNAQNTQIQRYIQKEAAESEGDMLMQEIRCEMTLYTYMDICVYDPLGREDKSVHLSPLYSRNCHIGTALIGKDGQITASNQFTLMSCMSFSDDDYDPARGWYICDPDALSMPEVDQLYADMSDIFLQEHSGYYPEMKIESAYVDKVHHSFIPHQGVMGLIYEPKTDEALIDDSSKEWSNTKEINITINDPDYELVTLHSISEKGKYPRAILSYPQGESAKALEQYQDEFQYREINNYKSEYEGFDENGNGIQTYTQIEPVYINKDLYWLTTCFTIDWNDPALHAFFRRWTIVFALAVILAALLLCWRKNTVNKAKYAFEDYQRDLTDHLAHDIKTPLMAISGYAENLLNGSLSETEQTEYLGAILKNVSFTDSLISRTLYLNHMDKTTAHKQETVRLTDTVRDAFGKYALLLDEKQITHNVSGDAEIRTDQAALETILENLISNAVKYTPAGGSIQAEADKKGITLTNTVAKKVNTKELKRPFVRGDAARSNPDGHGLGLAIAERAALISGYKLSLSCTDTVFTAKIEF